MFTSFVKSVFAALCNAVQLKRVTKRDACPALIGINFHKQKHPGRTSVSHIATDIFEQVDLRSSMYSSLVLSYAFLLTGNNTLEMGLRYLQYDLASRLLPSALSSSSV